MKAVVIGAGRVGCGFLGHLLAEAGHEVVVIARDAAIADRINRHNGYLVRLVRAGARPQEHEVRGVRAVLAEARDQVADEIAGAAMVGTAVGARHLDQVAPSIAAGLLRAAAPVNVVACENAANPGELLRQAVSRAGGATYDATRHGFASGLVFRIVAERLLDDDVRTPVTFTADNDQRLVVDGAGLVGSLPELSGLELTSSYPAWVRRKLYTFNAAHAAAAFLGRLKGYTYVHAAVRDPQIRAIVREIAELGRRGLQVRYGADLARGASIVPRLDNAALDDTVERVSADPLRKLAAEERLAGAAVCVQEAGLWPEPHAIVIAAAIRAAVQDGSTVLEPAQLLRTVCGLDPDAPTGRAVLGWLARWSAVPPGAVLANLYDCSWAWQDRTLVRWPA
jgi:mannitol-1-phosphate 5-dehydrogenase